MYFLDCIIFEIKGFIEHIRLSMHYKRMETLSIFDGTSFRYNASLSNILYVRDMIHRRIIMLFITGNYDKGWYDHNN